MRIADLVPGQTYVNGYGDRYVYLGPARGAPVRKVDFSGFHTFVGEAGPRAVWVATYVGEHASIGLGDPGAGKHAGWTWTIVDASNLREPLQAAADRVQRDEAVYAQFRELQAEVSSELAALGISVQIEAPRAPLFVKDYSGEQRFLPSRMVVTMTAEDLFKLLDGRGRR